jgi:hypothetical protein
VVAVVLGAALLAACGSDAAVARLENDTAQRVELRLCSDNACQRFDPPRYELDAGASVEVNVSESGVPNVYLVVDSTRQGTGCLPIVVHHPSGTVQVLVSSQLSCSEDVPGEWP